MVALRGRAVGVGPGQPAGNRQDADDDSLDQPPKPLLDYIMRGGANFSAGFIVRSMLRSIH